MINPISLKIVSLYKAMNHAPLVSVIITFLNAEKYFVESIESVLNQTYTNWELILVDDGSTDDSTRIAIEYKTKCPGKVRYYEHEEHRNLGISASRNFGVGEANGKYVATLDADDAWRPDKLGHQVEIMESNPEVGMVYGDTRYWYSWTGDESDQEQDFTLHEKIQNGSLKPDTVIYPPTLLILALDSKIWVASMSNVMMRKKLLEQIGGYEENFPGMHEDQAFLAKICLSSPVYVASECWDLYRQHPESCYNVAFKKGLWVQTELYYLDWLKNYLKRENVSDPELLKALNERRWKFRHPLLHKLNVYKNRISRKVIKTAKLLGGWS